MEFKRFVNEVPESRKPGFIALDLTPLWADAQAFALAIEAMAEPIRPLLPTHVLGLESQGFIFGAALAQKLGLGFVPARRPGKLPLPTLMEEFETEDGPEALEVREGSFKPGDRVLLVDDVLATGATAEAARRLVERNGAQALAMTLFVELSGLTGRERLAGMPVFSLLRWGA